MATIYRENCLDEDNNPNDLAKQINEKFKTLKCPHKFTGKKKGEICGENIIFDMRFGDYCCSSNKHFKKQCYDEQYCKIIFKIINNASQKEADGYKDNYYIKFNMNMLKNELKKLDIEYNDNIKPIGRPNKASPEGKTWSYYKGEWI
jgi:hypothetical protein